MTKAYKGQGMEGFVAKWYATSYYRTVAYSSSAASPELRFVDPQPLDAKLQGRGRHTKPRGGPFGSSDLAG
jgi:hypothetical protein